MSAHYVCSACGVWVVIERAKRRMGRYACACGHQGTATALDYELWLGRREMFDLPTRPPKNEKECGRGLAK